MSVKFLNLNRMYEALSAEIDQGIKCLFQNDSFIGGEAVEKFEFEWARYCESKFAVGVGNGLDALVLSLKALNIGKGDEVIVPANTFIATWLAISHCGATIIPVEPSPESFVIEANEIEKKITERTKVILPVHLYGNPADIIEIKRLAKKYRLFVIEDAAQAHGATVNEKRIGGHGDITVWSFYPGKNLGAFGDAGAITTNSSRLARKVALLRNYGSEVKYKHDIIGFNSRLDPVQAIVLSIKLKHLDEWNLHKYQTALFYCDEFSALPISLPMTCFPYGRAAFHQFVIKTDMRESLQSYLSAHGVGTMIHYPTAPFKQKAYKYLGYKNSDFPVTSRLSKQILSLPIDPLMESHEKQYVAHVVRKFFDR